MSAAVWVSDLHSTKRFAQSRRIGRKRVKRRNHRVNGVAELLPRDDLGARRVGDAGERVAQELGRIFNSQAQVRPER